MNICWLLSVDKLSHASLPFLLGLSVGTIIFATSGFIEGFCYFKLHCDVDFGCLLFTAKIFMNIFKDRTLLFKKLCRSFLILALVPSKKNHSPIILLLFCNSVTFLRLRANGANLLKKSLLFQFGKNYFCFADMVTPKFFCERL